MQNYWVEKIKKNKSGNWLLRVKNKHTGKQTQKTFKSNEFTKGEVKQMRKQILARDLTRNQDDYEYDPFNYISNDYNFLLGKAIELFMEYSKTLDLASTTLRLREAVLDAFKEWYGENNEVKSIQQKDIKDFINGCCDVISSKNQYASTLRQLFKFLRTEYDITLKTEVPTFGTKRQREKNRLKNPTIMSEEDLWKLYEYGKDKFPKDGKLKHFQDLQCLVIYFYTGLRKEELPHLKIRDIDLKGDHATAVVGKNKLTKSYKQRVIWLPEYCHNQLEFLMENKSADDYLLDHDRNSSQDSIMRSTIYVFKKLYEEVFPSRDNMSLHKLRHSCGCWLLEQGLSMMFVKRQLGHAKLDKTLIYARMTARGFKSEINKYKQRKTTNEQKG